MSDSFGSLAWMHIVELEPVEMAHGNEIIHPLFDYRVDAENFIISCLDLNRSLQKQESRQHECCFSPALLT